MATALAVASVLVAMLAFLDAGPNAHVLLADEAAPPATSEHTGTGDIGTGPQSTAPPQTQPSPEPATTTVAPRTLERSNPTAIVIPALDVDAEVMNLGLHEDGTMEVPPHAPRSESRAGWYRHSPTPGELGPSVIVGHVDSEQDGPSVFYGLGSLTAGDRVEVQRADRRTAVFEVEHVAQYGKDEFPTETVYGNLDYAGLRLITCGGDFDTASFAYEDNIVVYARLVSGHATPDPQQR